MIVIEDRYDVSWYCKRYLGLLVDFPSDLTPEILKNEPLCSQYDPEEVYLALKSAHAFLTGIAHEILEISKISGKKQDAFNYIFTKQNLIWACLLFCELKEESSKYCFYFKKPNLSIIDKNTGKKKNFEWMPKSYERAFQSLSDNECYVEYYKNGSPVNNFKTCDSGTLYFDDRLTALGLYLFFKKVIQKRWYQKYDIGGRYHTNKNMSPNKCREVFDRIDMRIFNCGERLGYYVDELLVGYNDGLKGYFKKIYSFVKENYPDCMPFIGMHTGVCFSITFGVDEEHRMIGQIDLGGNENYFKFYGALTNMEMDTALADIDSFSEKVVMLFLHEDSCKCDLCRKKFGELVYRGKLYNRIYKNTENRFLIENEDDANQAIKCIEIKAKCNMNTRTK